MKCRMSAHKSILRCILNSNINIFYKSYLEFFRKLRFRSLLPVRFKILSDKKNLLHSQENFRNWFICDLFSGKNAPSTCLCVEILFPIEGFRKFSFVCQAIIGSENFEFIWARTLRGAKSTSLKIVSLTHIIFPLYQVTYPEFFSNPFPTEARKKRHGLECSRSYVTILCRRFSGSPSWKKKEWKKRKTMNPN